MTELSTETIPEPAASAPSAVPDATRAGRSWTWLVVAGVAMMVLAMLLASVVRGDSSSGSLTGGAVALPGAARGSGITPGTQAPDFTLRTLDGGTMSLRDLRGQTVLVNFWATWCPPCRAEMPDIQQVYDERRPVGFAVLAVNVQEAKEPVAGFVTKYGLTFPTLLDTSGTVTQQYRISALPSSFLVDKDGNVADVHVGPLNKAGLLAKLNKVVGNSGQ